MHSKHTVLQNQAPHGPRYGFDPYPHTHSADAGEPNLTFTHHVQCRDEIKRWNTMGWVVNASSMISVPPRERGCVMTLFRFQQPAGSRSSTCEWEEWQVAAPRITMIQTRICRHASPRASSGWRLCFHNISRKSDRPASSKMSWMFLFEITRRAIKLRNGKMTASLPWDSSHRSDKMFWAKRRRSCFETNPKYEAWALSGSPFEQTPLMMEEEVARQRTNGRFSVEAPLSWFRRGGRCGTASERAKYKAWVHWYENQEVHCDSVV